MGETGAGQDFRRGLAAVVAGGAILRIVRLLVTKWNKGLLLNDSLYYSAQARQLAHGVWFREVFSDQPGAEHGPLTSTLMSVVSWGNDPTNRQRIITIVCGIATVAVIGLVARRVGGDRIGLIAAAIAAVYPNLWINDGLVMSESVSALLISLTMLVVLRWAESPSYRRAVICGAIVGLGALARSELILLAPLIAVVMLIVGRRAALSVAGQAMVVLVASIVVIAPWMIFNATRFDRTVLLTTNEGPLWLGANCEDSYYGPALGGWSLFCVVDAHIGENGEDTSVRSSEQRRLGVQYAEDHLRRLPVVVAARVGRTLDLYDVSGLVHGDVGEERERLATWAGVVAFWILAPLAAIGALRLRRLYLAVLLLPVVVVAVTTVVFYGGHRIRASAEPAIVILAACALGRWSSRAERAVE
ncbi:MAG TPA: glycosyltransferase family 39 protein [Ilumatobacteraceae bacterium]|nr:glycosyltransferase family 39 protein [Ilumatobacteraceae bacterium]